MVFTTPLLRALRRRFPDASLTYLVEPAAAPVVAGNPHLHELIVAPRRRGLAGLRDDVALIRRLRARQFDLVIDCHGGPRASLLTWLSGAPVRIGYEVVGRAWMYTTRVARARALLPRHSVESQWDLLTALGAPAPTRDGDPVEMPVAATSAAAIAGRIADAGGPGEDPLVVMHVSAGNPFRRWPLPSFASVAAALTAGPQPRRVVVTSGPSERDAARTVITTARALLPPDRRGQLLDLGELSLTDLRALLERAALYVGGDSGPLHIAATSRVPIVALFGPTLPARSMPWRPDVLHAEAVEPPPLDCRPCDQRVCVHGDFRCLGLITPDQVVAAAERALAAGSQPGARPRP